MKAIFSRLAKQQSKTFKVSYALEYRTFTIQHVATDPSHPLHETQKRRLVERKKQGLWWHATTGVDLSKSSCVRAWARRRLRTAVEEELRQRDYDENGMMLRPKVIHGRTDQTNVLHDDRTLDLTGSLRLQIQPPLLSARFIDVRAEVGQILEIILQVLKESSGGQKSVRKTGSRPQIVAPRAKVPQLRRSEILLR